MSRVPHHYLYPLAASTDWACGLLWLTVSGLWRARRRGLPGPVFACCSANRRC